MPSRAKSAQQADPSDAAPALFVVRRYQAFGECRELGIHAIPLGYIEVEELSDGTFRMADDGGNPLPAAPPSAPSEPDALEIVPDADVATEDQAPEAAAESDAPESDPSAADAVSEPLSPADEPPAASE